MSHYPVVICKFCGKEFESQIKIDPAVYAMYPNLGIGQNTFTCPHCNKSNSYSEVDFKYTEIQANELASFGKIVKVFYEHVQSSNNPILAAAELLEEFENARASNNVSTLNKSIKLAKLKKWLPNSPEKLAAYIVIAQVLVQLLTKTPGKQIEYNNVVNKVNQTIIIQNINISNETKYIGKRKIARNKPCPCGSQKIYKYCCGKLK